MSDPLNDLGRHHAENLPAAFRQSFKTDLLELSDGLLANDPHSIEWCVRFLLAESRGIGHGRVRARIARRLKHCELTGPQRCRLVDCVAGRLQSGNFSEQFRDQLRLALAMDAHRLAAVAAACKNDSRPHVCRLARWTLERYAERQRW